MRARSASLEAILQSDNIQSFFLVKITTPLTTLLDTTYFRPLTVAGVGTFSPYGGLLTVEAPRLSEVVDREVYRLSYADPEFSKIAMLEGVLTGSKVTVYTGFVNTTDTTLSGVEPGQPLLDLQDMLIAYEGVIDTQGYTLDPQEGTVVVVLECASPVAALGLSRAYTTSKEAQKQRNPADTAYDYVYIDAAKMTLKWGKE